MPTSRSDDAMAHEFDTLPLWTADAVDALGPDHALPAGFRGSGSPDALRWLTLAMGLRRGTRLVDAGAGEGGPAELVAREVGVEPVLLDPMPGACIAARRLFGRPVLVADGGSLPFADDTFDAGWSIGVLCTVPDKTRALSELRRVVRRGGPVGLLVFVRTVAELPEQPEGNSFPDAGELSEAIAAAGLVVTHHAGLDDFAGPDAEWQERVEAVDRAVAEAHGGDERLVAADEQARTIGRLMSDGLLVGRLLVARAH